MVFPLNLSRYYNHIIYKSDYAECVKNYCNKTIYGLPHIENIHAIDPKKERLIVNNTIFHLAPKDNILDNVMCDGQIIGVNIDNISTMMFLGFSEMGTVCDEVTLYTKDNRTVKIPLVLKTFHSDSFGGIDDGEKNSKCKLAYYLSGDDGQKHGVYIWTISIGTSQDIDNIQLPDNCAMHLLAITLLSIDIQ